MKTTARHGLKALTFYVAISIFLATLPVAHGQADPTASAAAATVEITVPVLDARAAASAGADTLANRPGAVVSLSGQKQPCYLPVAADTCLWKDDARSRGSDSVVSVRDGRFCQGLFKLNLDALPAGATIETAQFRAFSGWRERPGGATLKVYRLLTDWSEDATWFKPFADQQRAWNGLRPGVDFEAQPFATFQRDDFPAGKFISVDGFESVVRGWAAKKWPNYGFLVTLSGKAMHVNLSSREAEEKRTDTALTLGGPDESAAVVQLDLPLLRRALLATDDVQAAALRLKIAKKTGDLTGASIQLYRLLPASGDIPAKPGEPLAAAPLSKLTAEGLLDVGGLETALRNWLEGRWPDGGLLVTLQSPAKKRPQLTLANASSGKNRPALLAGIRSYPKADLFDHQPKPQPGVYASVQDGHLFYGEGRLRLWGMVGYHAGAERTRKMGFNAQRLWKGPKLYDDASAKRGEPLPFAKDGPIDPFDQYFAEVKKLGQFVMFAALTESMPMKGLLDDDSFVAGGPDWQQWKQAAGAKGADVRRFVLFDERLQTIRKRHAANLLNHVNPCTGKRYAEDEAIVIYEIFNENGFVYWTLEKGFDGWPAYFRDKLQKRWNQWLAARYQNEAGLKAAWGQLNPGETLAHGSVKLAPVSADRSKYPAQRGSDLIRFLSEVLDRFNQDFRQYCRSLAPAGVGVNVVPFSFDTQYRPSLPWVYTSALGDINCFGMYFWGLHSELSAPPAMYVLDNHTVAGKPTVLYETNQGRPSRYRAEYPLRLAALASWQDWDGVFWHYWAGLDAPDEQYMVEPMQHVNASHYWTGVQHERDPVMDSAMAIAGRIFLGRGIRPAPKPVTFQAGSQAIFGYDYFNGLGMGGTTFSQGSRIAFAPDRNEGITVGGGPAPAAEKVTAAVAAGNELLWDWPNGRLIIDTPTVKAYVGQTAGAYRFKDGIVLSGVSTPFVTFALVSADGKPLAGPDSAGKMYVTAVFDAQNTDFKFDWSVTGGPLEQVKAIRSRGRAPVIVDRVGYTLSFPTLLDYRFDGYDFALRRTWQHRATASNVLAVADRELFFGLLTIDGRGAAAEAVIAQDNRAAAGAVAAVQAPAGGSAKQPTKLWNPLPGLNWGDSFVAAHQLLRDSRFHFTSISPLDASDRPEKQIMLTGAEAILASAANIQIFFLQDRMTKITATFTHPPALREAVAAYEQQFGKPLEKTIAADAFAASTVRWLVKEQDATLAITLSETQGTLTLVYQRQ